MSAIARILLLARLYQEATELKPVTLSWRLFGDSKKLAAIQRGADMQVTRYERALQWFSDNWPSDLSWPVAAGDRPPRTPEPANTPAPQPEALSA